MKKKLSKLFVEEYGAITLDWIVLAAGVFILSLSIVASIQQDIITIGSGLQSGISISRQ